MSKYFYLTIILLQPPYQLSTSLYSITRNSTYSHLIKNSFTRFTASISDIYWAPIQLSNNSSVSFFHSFIYNAHFKYGRVQLFFLCLYTNILIYLIPQLKHLPVYIFSRHKENISRSFLWIWREAGKKKNKIVTDLNK